MTTLDDATGQRSTEPGPRPGGPGGRRVRRRAVAAALLAGALVTALAAGCTTSGEPGDDGRGTGGQTGGDGGRTRTSPATATGPVLAVKIDNVRAARPQTGLDAADLVYVEPVEGGLSRLMAVYASKLPRAVGPVRSARESDLELLRQFDRPVLAFSGAQRKLLPLIDSAPLVGVTPGKAEDAYYRGTDKAPPHNLYVRPDRLLPAAPGRDALTTGFRYGPAPSGGTRLNARTVRYPSARFTFTWSPDRQRYDIATDGTPTVGTDGRRVEPATVVVQHVRVRASGYHDVLGNRTPYTETVGSGTAEVLRDGRSYDAAWTRSRPEDGTRFTTPDGRPLPFAEGQVWVVFADTP